ncbi:MAG TPA: TonB-dependent receptor [Terriglobales bacterium]|nr:TonB-dependent receptor [Terriglobales bacterium]
MSTHCLPEENRRCHLSPAIAFVLSCIFVLALCLTPRSAHAQVLYGTLTGNVTDTTGALLPGAKVQVVNLGTGTAAEQTTGSDGVYRFTDLPAGQYKVTISADKFAPAVFDSIRIDFNTVRRIDAALKVGASETSVEVTTEPPLLQTDKADVHTDFSTLEIENFPVISSQGRSFQSLLRIVPGVSQIAENNSIAGNPQRGINANVNGQSNQTINTRLDGVQDAYPWLPANTAYVPPEDAIEEVNVVTNSFDAEQGMAGGAAVNAHIKSGTNSFHGNAHELHTDQNFAARNYFQTDPSIFPKKNRNNQNQFGGIFGGPIKKDKLFFFTDYERTTQRQLAGPDLRTLPTAAMLQGDFRNLPGNPIIYDPSTGDVHGAGKSQISCNGVANVICPNRIDPASSALIKLISPELSQVFATSNDLNNFVGSGTALFNRDNADFKIDYLPAAATTVFGRYSFSRTLVFDPPLLGDAGGDATNGGQLGNAPGLVQSVGLGATHTFTPTVLLDWNFGFTRQRLGAQYDLASARGLNDLKIPGTNGAGVPGDTGAAGDLYNGLPAFSLSVPGGNVSTLPGIAAAGSLNLGNPNTGNPFIFRDQQFVSDANLSWVKGKHALRGGIEWNHTQLNHFQPQGGSFQTPRGTFQFNGNVTSLQGSSPTWFNSWADFLLGLPSATGKAVLLFNPVALRWSQWAWYVRDQWQVFPKLTVTLGVRWEYYPFGYSDHDTGLRWFNPATGNVLLGGYGGVPRDDGIDVGSGQFLPRLGVAYRLTEKTVLRGGYGMSADPNNWRYFRNSYPSVVISTNQPKNTGDYIAAASLTGVNGTGLGAGTYSVPTGVVLLPLPDLSSGTIALPTNASTTTIPNPFRRGYVNSFNLMIQQEWKGFVAETGYVGARAVRPLTNMNINPSPAGTGSASGLISTALIANYSGTINSEEPFKNNYYNSLQTKVTRQMGRGSMVGFAWTWSKSINYSDNEELNFLLFPYPAYWQKNRGLASFDRTHNIAAYAVYRLPFGKGQRWATSGPASWLAGGWQISPMISHLSGVPFTVTGPSSGNQAGFGGTQTADLVGSYSILAGQPLRTGQTCVASNLACHYFDPTVFAAPNVTGNPHLGNTNRDEFRGPGYFNLDASLLRDFRVTERIGFQIRADAFSLTNTPHFSNPNVGCNSQGGQLCSSVNNNFGVITSTLGANPGSRSVWLGAKVTF